MEGSEWNEFNVINNNNNNSSIEVDGFHSDFCQNSLSIKVIKNKMQKTAVQVAWCERACIAAGMRPCEHGKPEWRTCEQKSYAACDYSVQQAQRV